MGRSLVFRLIFNRIIKLGILRSIASKLCDLNERLDGLPSSEPLLSGTQACAKSSERDNYSLKPRSRFIVFSLEQNLRRVYNTPFLVVILARNSLYCILLRLLQYLNYLVQFIASACVFAAKMFTLDTTVSLLFNHPDQ